MDIKVIIDDKRMQSVLASLDHGFSDFRPLLNDFSEVQLKSADEAFKTRGGNIGQPWKTLKMQTIKQKIKIGKNIDILQRSGKMRKSFRVSKLNKNELEIENTVSYFKYHQTGTRKMPQRQMLGHSPALIKRYEIAFIDYILKLIQK